MPGIGPDRASTARRAHRRRRCAGETHGAERASAMTGAIRRTTRPHGRVRHRHRHVRRRPQHRREGAGGPGLVRRRQPAAGPAARHGRAGRRRPAAAARIAVVVDVRSLAFSTDLRRGARGAGRRAASPAVVFLEAYDEVLVRRFENVRRPHPLQGDGRLVDGIAARARAAARVRGERRPGHRHLQPQRPPARARKIEAFFGGEDRPGLRVTVVSFGFKYGLPVDADLVVDCRFLPNPHWVPSCARRPASTPPSASTCSASAARRSSSTPTTRCCGTDRRRLPARGQALPDARGRLHRRQAPQRRHGRAARPPAARPRVASDACHGDVAPRTWAAE